MINNTIFYKPYANNTNNINFKGKKKDVESVVKLLIDSVLNEETISLNTRIALQKKIKYTLKNNLISLLEAHPKSTWKKLAKLLKESLD